MTKRICVTGASGRAGRVTVRELPVHGYRVVWASSETTLGLPLDEPPRYAPVDEDHYPVPASSYAPT